MWGEKHFSDFSAGHAYMETDLKLHTLAKVSSKITVGTLALRMSVTKASV